MGQLMAIDFGNRRCGIAVTDDVQIIASGLTTVETPKLIDFMKEYFLQNSVEGLVVGLPTDLRGNLSAVETDIKLFLQKVKHEFPELPVHRLDERFTSKMASYFISQSGKSKKKKEEKGLTDKVSATLLLQNFLDQR